MIRRAIEKANTIYERYGNDLALICDELGLSVMEENLKGNLREVYFGDAIVIRKDLKTCQKRELIAHALCHHLLHNGNELYKHRQTLYSYSGFHERQANVFAAYLLMPVDRFERQLFDTNYTGELAEYFEVSLESVEFRLKMRAAYERLNSESKKITINY